MDKEIGLSDITIIKNKNAKDFGESFELKLIEGDNRIEMAPSNFVLHEMVKHSHVEEMYKHVANILKQGGHQAVDKEASSLDVEGLAALHYAATQPSIVAARLLLDQGVNLDVESKCGETPLHIALRYGNIQMASILTDRGARLEKVDFSGNNALHLAVEKGLRGMAVKILMRCPFLVYSQNNTGSTALHFAAVCGDAQLCEKLVSCEAKVIVKNINGETPLHLASLQNHVDILKVLLEKASPSKEGREKFLSLRRNDGFTALHIAANMGHTEAVRYMVDLGTNVNPCAAPGPSALQLAAGGGHIEVMKLLLCSGAALDAKDQYGNTALHRAALNGNTEVVSLLLSHGADLEAANEDGWTPLFFAVIKKHGGVLHVLLQNGADCTKVDNRLSNCLFYAMKNVCCNLISMLLQYGGNGLIFGRNIENRLLLHEAVMTGNEKVLELLLTKCSGTIIYGEGRKTLIHLAAENGKERCLQILIDVWPRAYLDMPDSNEQTALHLAAQNGHTCSCHYLIDGKADMTCVDKDGYKALHLAVMKQKNDVVEVMIMNKVEIVPEDIGVAISAGNVVALKMFMDHLGAKYIGSDVKLLGLEQAIDGDCQEVLECIVHHDSFQDAVRHGNISIERVMPKMIAKYPEVVVKVLDKGITISDHLPDSKDFEVTYDFTALESSPYLCDRTFGTDVYFGPSIMSDLDREHCLAHPLTQKLIDLKWSSHGALVFYFSLFVYLMFIVSITVLIVLERQGDMKSMIPSAVKVTSNTTNTTTTTTKPCSGCTTTARPFHSHKLAKTRSGQMIAITIFGFLCIQVLKEMAQILIQWKRYFSDPTNLLEWIIFAASFGYLKGFLFEQYHDFKYELTFAVCCLFFGWLNVLIFLRRSPAFNIYVVMFTQVVFTLIRVLFVFSPLLLAFALAFQQLFVKQTVFTDVWRSYMKTFVMLTGELEYADTIPSSIGKKDATTTYPLVPIPELSYILFGFFIIMIPVALMNLLVGLAVGDIESIRKTAKCNVRKQQAKYIKELHTKCPKWVLTWTYATCHTERPNDISWIKRLILTSSFAGEEFMSFLEERLSERQEGKDETQLKKLIGIERCLVEQKRKMAKVQKTLEDQVRAMTEIKAARA